MEFVTSETECAPRLGDYKTIADLHRACREEINRIPYSNYIFPGELADVMGSQICQMRRVCREAQSIGRIMEQILCEIITTIEEGTRCERCGYVEPLCESTKEMIRAYRKTREEGGSGSTTVDPLPTTSTKETVQPLCVPSASQKYPEERVQEEDEEWYETQDEESDETQDEESDETMARLDSSAGKPCRHLQ